MKAAFGLVHEHDARPIALTDPSAPPPRVVALNAVEEVVFDVAPKNLPERGRARERPRMRAVRGRGGLVGGAGGPLPRREDGARQDVAHLRRPRTTFPVARLLLFLQYAASCGSGRSARRTGIDDNPVGAHKTPRVPLTSSTLLDPRAALRV
jgi:hypothetical protein